jgi:hypothetical protein
MKKLTVTQTSLKTQRLSPPILALLPIVTAKVQPTPRRFPCCPFDLGRTVDGIVRTKQGQHISVREPNTPQSSSFTSLNPARSHDHDKDRDRPSKPTYTPHLLQYNMHNLKMRYKRITQKRARLMRAIRKTHNNSRRRHRTQENNQLNDKLNPLANSANSFTPSSYQKHRHRSSIPKTYLCGPYRLKTNNCLDKSTHNYGPCVPHSLPLTSTQVQLPLT